MERDLPESFTTLAEDEQDRRIDLALSVVWCWAAEEGADRMRVEVMPSDADLARRVGLEASGGRGLCFVGPFSVSAGIELLAANPERVWVWAGDRPLVFVYETWDTVVVQLPEAQVGRFSAQLTAALS
ncbi:hypothetical protein [Cellulomonas sp. NS3]|uniref:hypothetical protein n=1 Tax=Cellulomonas sp. NS3 TaxID=2973977 RepID=UPI00216123E7|nr:hypothetical protein [Cellulomonas sp. NS3]